jgi:hypothetical protein
MRPPREVGFGVPWRRGWDSNPRALLKGLTFSRRPRSATPAPLQIRYVWQAGQESNLQPADLEAAALPIELPAYVPADNTTSHLPLQPGSFW